MVNALRSSMWPIFRACARGRTAPLRFVVAALVVCAVTPPASAQAITTGNQLYALCPNQGDQATTSFRQIELAGFIEGALDAANRTKPVCFPPGSTRGQNIDLVCVYLMNHPATRHLSGSRLVETAIRDVFECASR